MDKQLLINLLPGLSGHVIQRLHDEQLNKLLRQYRKNLPIKSIVSKNGYLLITASITAPIVGQIEIKPQIAIDSIDVSSRKLVIRSRILNVNTLIQKALSYLIGHYGLDIRMNDGILSINLTEQWVRALSDLTDEARKKLDNLTVDVEMKQGEMIVGMKMA